MTANEPQDLDALAEWCRRGAPLGLHGMVRPQDLQRPPWSLHWNAACSALEALEARGDLERIPGTTLAWRPAPGPQKPGKGYTLPLSPKERAALLRALDAALEAEEEARREVLSTIAAAVPNSRVSGGDSEDQKLWRAIRSRLKRP